MASPCPVCNPQLDSIMYFNQHNPYHTCVNNIVKDMGFGPFGSVIKVFDDNHSKYALIKYDECNCNVSLHHIQSQFQLFQKRSFFSPLDSFSEGPHFYISFPLFDSRHYRVITSDIKSEADALGYFTKVCYAAKEIRSYDFLTKSMGVNNIFLPVASTSSTYLAFAKWDKIGKAYNANRNPGILRVQNVHRNAGDIDVFMLGVLLFGLISGMDFFDCYNQLMFGNFLLSITPKVCFPNTNISKLTMCILEGCLQLNKDIRIEFNEILKLLTIDINNDKSIQHLQIFYENGNSNVINLQNYDLRVDNIDSINIENPCKQWKDKRKAGHYSQVSHHKEVEINGLTKYSGKVNLSQKIAEQTLGKVYLMMAGLLVLTKIAIWYI